MRGVPLEEIATATKISVRCLQALEAEEFSKLPGGIFTRSFIRTYAKYLGLDEETVMAEFQAVGPRVEEADLSRLTPTKAKPSQEKSRAIILGLLVAVAVLAGGYALYRYSSRANDLQGTHASPSRLTVAPTQVTSSPQQSTPPAATGTTAAAPSVTGPNTVEGSANSNRQDGSKLAQPTPTTTQTPTGANGAEPGSALTLQVAATEQTWLAVDADGKTVMQRVLKPNDIQTFKAKNSFDVMTGNAQGIILTLNGETLKPLGHHGESKKVHITQSDLKNNNP
jgi:cytoskeleton protein RodZ